MLLRIVIGLIRIVGSRVRTICGCGGIFACWVIATVSTVHTVCGVVVHTIPTHTCLLATAKEARYDLCTIAIPTQIAVVGIQIRSRAVEETVRIDLRESSIGTPLVRQYDMRIHHFAKGIVHTAVEGYAYPRTLRGREFSPSKGEIEGVCLHINTRTERSATIGRSADTALHIQRGHTARHIGHVHPEDGLALAIVERHIVERHIDTRVVRTTNTKIGITYS